MSSSRATLAILLLPLIAAAQDPTSTSKPVSKESGRPSDEMQEIGLPEEMRIRLAIERAEGEHRKVLEDVRKLSDLSSEVASAMKERGRLGSDEFKKLATIEKLAKRILSHAGGSETDDKSNQLGPASVAAAVDYLDAAIGRIRKDMISHTRHVVSATVIASSNEVIHLAQFLRRTKKSS
jgi:hypothetical protein